MSTPTWGIPATCSGEGCVGLAGWRRGTAESVPPPSATTSAPQQRPRARAYTTSMRAPVFSAWIS